jgi:hypothetical protein
VPPDQVQDLAECHGIGHGEAQGQITGRLARSFDLELAAAADRRIARERVADPDAQVSVLRGRACLIRSSSSETRHEAQRAFERALDIDPQSIDAKVYLAITLVLNLLDGWSRSPLQDQARAEQLLLEVLEQDSNLAKGPYAPRTTSRSRSRSGSHSRRKPGLCAGRHGSHW